MTNWAYLRRSSLPMSIALALCLGCAVTTAVAQKTDLAGRAGAAIAVREAVIAASIAVLEEGPEVHSPDELAAAMVALRDLRATDVYAIRQVVRYLNYQFPANRDPNAWFSLEDELARPSAWSTLQAIGPRAAPYVIAQIGAGHEGDGGVLYASVLESLLGPLTDEQLRMAAAAASDPAAAGRIEAFRVKYNSVFRESGTYSLPQPVRPVRAPAE